MIHPASLLPDLKRWVTRLEDDLRERCDEEAAIDAPFRAAYAAAKKARRTALPYATWRDQELTQVAVGWVLATVFLRFLEDNGLVDTPWLSGPGERHAAAAHTRGQWFEKFPVQSDTDYLRHVFTEAARLPGIADLLDTRHNPLWQAPISGDAAAALITFWRTIDSATGTLAHDFTDPAWDTRFLGDLYQDLSEAARKRFALLQTPDFVESFILDRTLEPAVETFGHAAVRLLDPACGSGHFLLGGLRRMLAHWRRADPALSPKDVARHALAAIHGVDINPFAVAIARFRLLLEAWRYSGVSRLREAPAFSVKLAVGDALLHGRRFRNEFEAHTGPQRAFDIGGDFQDEIAHFFEVEDRDTLHEILGQQYHAVVANPPYITVKDKALNELYRQRFDSCAGKYALSVPFMERIFELALTGSKDDRRPAGFTGQITSNSFMKRGFGKKLIEDFIPKWNLTHIIDTSGAYIPGHGTPTVILFGTNETPATPTLRTVMGIKGEPSTPANPANGKVWRAIIGQIDQRDSESDFVSTADSERNRFSKHPWSMGGGGAAELKLAIDSQAKIRLESVLTRGSIGAVTGEDEAYAWNEAMQRLTVSMLPSRELIEGDNNREWITTPGVRVIFPYDEQAKPDFDPRLFPWLWNFRTNLISRVWFGTQHSERGLFWWEYAFVSQGISQATLTITFGEVATHNHFVLDRGGKVFNRTAPVIKLAEDASEADHLRLLGLLNSSAACFWMKQVFYPKGGDHVGNEGARVRKTLWDERYQIDGTKLKQFPIPAEHPEALPTRLDTLAQELSALAPAKVLTTWAAGTASLAEALASAEQAAASRRARMIALQEELDWQCYRLYGLTEATDALEWREDRLDDLPELTLGERAFEIGMARALAAGELETTWFARHAEAGSRPVTDLPAHWPAAYRALVERRLAFIAENKNIGLIERPEYKRRWNTEPWAKRREAALRQWLLTRLESYFFDADRMIEAPDEAARATLAERLRPCRAAFPGGQAPALCTTRQVADAAALDPQWMEAAEAYTGETAFDVPALVRTLVERESVPYLPAQRYKASGRRHRAEWERTWDLQRQEDAVEARVRAEHPGLPEERLQPLIRETQKAEVGEIPVPPKYKSADFAKTVYWSLRGKLDVPKERWVLYPGAERAADPSPVIAWAGWTPKEQIQALGAWYCERQSLDGWTVERLSPLLAGMKDLLPWVKQWHGGIDPEFGQDLGDFYEGFLRSQSHDLHLTDTNLERERLGLS